MISTHRLLRPLLFGAVALALATGAGGCSWFKKKTDYASSQESRPLEVPPDLNLPDTSAATSLPATASAVVGGSGLRASETLVPGQSAADLYPKIGAALESIEGVTISGRAEALGSYDVSYRGESFLLRAQDSQGGSRLVALAPDGRLLTTGPAADLLKLVRAKL
jgi:uncharacterized lipoprotein